MIRTELISYSVGSGSILYLLAFRSRARRGALQNAKAGPFIVMMQDMRRQLMTNPNFHMAWTIGVCKQHSAIVDVDAELYELLDIWLQVRRTLFLPRFFRIFPEQVVDQSLLDSVEAYMRDRAADAVLFTNSGASRAADPTADIQHLSSYYVGRQVVPNDVSFAEHKRA